VQLGASGQTDEELLMVEEEDGLSIALYLSPELIQRLQPYANAPASDFLEHSLGTYCSLAEGVSHFLYLTQTALQKRRVSFLELEAQAEIDKFASCVLYRWEEGPAYASTLMGRLFERVTFRPHLDQALRYRYEEANRLARNYCRGLLRHVVARRMDLLLSDLRYVYRLGAEAKLANLATCRR
jgi:hypothetical protein